jgi:hypothetical protein
MSLLFRFVTCLWFLMACMTCFDECLLFFLGCFVDDVCCLLATSLRFLQVILKVWAAKKDQLPKEEVDSDKFMKLEAEFMKQLDEMVGCCLLHLHSSLQFLLRLSRLIFLASAVLTCRIVHFIVTVCASVHLLHRNIHWVCGQREARLQVVRVRHQGCFRQVPCRGNNPESSTFSRVGPYFDFPSYEKMSKFRIILIRCLPRGIYCLEAVGDFAVID